MSGPYDNAGDMLLWWRSQGQKLWLLLRERGSRVTTAVPGRLHPSGGRHLTFGPDDGRGTHYYIDVDRARDEGRVVDEQTVDLDYGRAGTKDPAVAAEVVFRLVTRVSDSPPSFPG